METLSFSGYNWIIKDSPQKRTTPGRNYYSSSRQNVWIDENGYLHVKVTQQQQQWYSASLQLDHPLGFGMYDFFVISKFDELDINTVISLSLYEDESHEIAVELSYKGHPPLRHPPVTHHPFVGRLSANNLTYKVKSDNMPSDWLYEHVALEGTYTTHRIIWQPEQVTFASLHGHYQEDPPAPAYRIKEWTYPKSYSLSPVTPASISLWVWMGGKPEKNQEVEVTIAQFLFTKLS